MLVPKKTDTSNNEKKKISKGKKRGPCFFRCQVWTIASQIERRKRARGVCKVQQIRKQLTGWQGGLIDVPGATSPTKGKNRGGTLKGKRKEKKSGNKARLGKKRKVNKKKKKPGSTRQARAGRRRKNDENTRIKT